MMAAVGSESSFLRGREQLQLLAGDEVTTKAVERHAEAIRTDIVRREQTKRNRVADILGAAVPVMYVALDGTQQSWKVAWAEAWGNRRIPGK